MDYGWRGKQVRNSDGRTGVISSEDGFGAILDLHIKTSDGANVKVTLNARGSDTGEPRWQWWCPEFSPEAAWLPLGEHGAPVAYGQPPNA